ncbi:hypothetical protein SAMN05216315_11132 [Nitrosospira sp. Nsp18]|uniref:hypothetical protein n=1 Tax=Nitrosospira sp. Nsp18 TaxID=1855334 RepID=UPI0008872484|nr:hypothetical protein [Nitrosospira sp. Nsp18]SDA19063.1 hypothetical protein SAMN05216315_11132 [Nitrosospira sp. Nsp18]
MSNVEYPALTSGCPNPIVTRPAIPGSCHRNCPVIIAMVVMRVMEVAIDKIVHVIAMRHGFMAAVRSMYMFLRMARALMFRRTAFRIGRGYVYHMLIEMVAVRVMQMPVMQVIDMPVVHDTCVAAFGSMRMSMIFMLWQDTISHFAALLQKEIRSARIQV